MKNKDTDFQVSMNLNMRVKAPSNRVGILFTAVCTAISIGLWLLT